MLNLQFQNLNINHTEQIMDIFNYYVENSFSAYPEKKLPSEFFNKFLEMTNGYPAYSIFLDTKIVGFCFLRAYNPFPAFKSTAEISYFIEKDYSGKGIGKIALEKLENDARKMGIQNILASITSENQGSLNFHKKNGFVECGKFSNVMVKFGKSLDIIWMQKQINTYNL